MRKKVLALGMAAVMALSLSACAGGGGSSPAAPAAEGEAAVSSQTYKLTFQTCLAAGTPNYEMAERYVENVKKASGGRIQIDLYAVGAISEYNEMANAVKDGTLDMAAISTGSQSGLLGKKAYLFGGSGSPGGFNPDEFLAWVYEGGGEEIMRDYIDPTGVHFLTICTASGAELFCHSNVKLESVADFKGVKFRTLGMWADVLTEIGASVVNVSGGEIYQSAEKGLIDAFEYCDAAINYTMGYQDIMKYTGVPGIHSPVCTEAMYINQDTWNSLPEDLQTILYECTKAMALESPYYFAKQDADAMEKFAEKGVEFFTLSEETQREFLDITYGLQKQYMEEEEGYKDIFAHQKAFLDQYKKNDRTVQITMSTYDFDLP
ncbi:TRAP transporter substrate-binding protein DctP [Lachnospiraceae bacterium 62-35]